MAIFDSKQFQIRREDTAVATWVGPKDDETLGSLIALFRREKWRGQFVVNFPGNGGINDVVFTEKKARKVAEDREATAY